MSPETDSFLNALRGWMRLFMRRSMHEFTMWMKRTGLSMSQIGALMRLHHHGACPISCIGDDLAITPAAASQMVDRLVGLGLLRRDEDPQDRRVKIVALTPQGRALIREGIETRTQWLENLEAAIPESRRSAIAEALRDLTQAAQHLEDGAKTYIEKHS